MTVVTPNAFKRISAFRNQFDKRKEEIRDSGMANSGYTKLRDPKSFQHLHPEVKRDTFKNVSYD